jgi:hypothetical protein
MSLRSSTDNENGRIPLHMLNSPNRHSRAGGNPDLIPAELAWIPAFAGMTEPRNRFVTQINHVEIFAKEARRSRIINIRNFVPVVLLSLIILVACANFVARRSPLRTPWAIVIRPYSRNSSWDFILRPFAFFAADSSFLGRGFAALGPSGRKESLPAYFVVLIPRVSMIPAIRLVSSSMNFL